MDGTKFYINRTFINPGYVSFSRGVRGKVVVLPDSETWGSRFESHNVWWGFGNVPLKLPTEESTSNMATSGSDLRGCFKEFVQPWNGCTEESNWMMARSWSSLQWDGYLRKGVACLGHSQQQNWEWHWWNVLDTVSYRWRIDEEGGNEGKMRKEEMKVKTAVWYI